MEPATVLVRAFQVQIDLAAFGHELAVGHRGPRHAGFEPHVHDVVSLVEIRAVTARAGRASGRELLDGPREPGAATLGGEDVRHVPHGGGFEEGLVARLAQVRRDGHAPHALA